MARKTYTEEFRIEAVKQVTENGYEIADTAHSDVPTLIQTGDVKDSQLK